MSLAALRDAWLIALPHTSKIVLVCLADHLNEETGRCDPSVSTLAKRCGLTERSVQTQLQKLELVGLVHREERRGTSYKFTLNLRTSFTPEQGSPPKDVHPTLEADSPQPPKDVHLTPERCSPKPEVTRKRTGKKPKQRTCGLTIQEWFDHLENVREPAIPETAGVFDYAQSVGLSVRFLEIAWLEFEKKYRRRPDHRQSNWRLLYRNHVEKNWLNLWRIDQTTGDFVLTTAGLQAEREHFGSERVGAAVPEPVRRPEDLGL